MKAIQGHILAKEVYGGSGGRSDRRRRLSRRGWSVVVLL